MTDRPFADGGDPAVAPEPGYYPDPSIPGFIRYWSGSAWVPGTSRPAPAEGEVPPPPRYATRPAAPGRPPARAVPPPVVPGAAAPAAGAESGTVSGSASGPVPAAASGAVPGARSAGGGDTGPMYFDQTSGGASFVLGPRVAEVIGGPVFRTVAPAGAAAATAAGGVSELSGVSGASGASGASEVSEARVGARVPGGAGIPAGSVDEWPAAGAVAEAVAGAVPEESGWQADPRAQRGLMETGGAQRWVSWGVLPGAPDAEEGRAEPEPASAAKEEVAAAVGPARAVARAVTVRESPVPAVEASGVVPVIEEAEAKSAVADVSTAAPTAAPTAASVTPKAAGATGATGVRGATGSPGTPVAGTAVARTTPLPAVRQARPSAARRRTPSGAAAAVPAGLGRRLAARVVDTVVLLVVAVAAGIPLGRSVSDHLQQKLDQARMASALTRRQVQVWLVDDVVLGKVAVLIGILLFVGLLYEVLPTARTGQTFGKRLARIRVVDVAAPAARGRLSLGRSLLRWAVRQTGAVLLLGLLWPALDRPLRRGWQDRAARTRVVRG